MNEMLPKQSEYIENLAKCQEILESTIKPFYTELFDVNWQLGNTRIVRRTESSSCMKTLEELSDKLKSENNSSPKERQLRLEYRKDILASLHSCYDSEFDEIKINNSVSEDFMRSLSDVTHEFGHVIERKYPKVESDVKLGTYEHFIKKLRKETIAELASLFCKDYLFTVQKIDSKAYDEMKLMEWEYGQPAIYMSESDMFPVNKISFSKYSKEVIPRYGLEEKPSAMAYDIVYGPVRKIYNIGRIDKQLMPKLVRTNDKEFVEILNSILEPFFRRKKSI